MRGGDPWQMIVLTYALLLAVVAVVVLLNIYF